MKIIFVIVLILSFSGIRASTCKPLKSSVLGNCDNNGCHELFFIKEVYYGIECGRRPVITAVPDWAKNVIEFEISSSKQPFDSATYLLNIFINPSRLLTENESNIEKYILYRNENKSTKMIDLLKYPQNEYTNQKKQFQFKERMEFVVMVIAYLFNGVFLFLIVILEGVYLYGLEKKKIIISTLSYFSFFLLLFVSRTIPLESFNLLFSFVFIPLLLVVNIFVLIIDKIKRSANRFLN